MGVKFSFWSDGSGKVLARIYSEDMSGTLHLTGIIADYMNKNSEFERNGLATIVTIDNTFKRVVLSFRGNEADTYYIKIYEIFLFKII
ncbi:MAG: hypothetical protein DRJ03_21575 [Chloroflexi bacterium]|nr:MAG: hypothetical protein DRJ03_21575 [Chloroflexota bacterium]